MITPSFIPWAAFVQLYAGLVSALPDQLSIRVGSADCTEGKVYQVQVARSDAEKRKGLGGVREALSSEQGMVFAFSPPAPQSFWMKDTHIPLSIFFFDEKGMLISKAEMEVESDPDNPVRFYQEPRFSSVALEAASGSTALHEVAQSYLCASAVS